MLRNKNLIVLIAMAVLLIGGGYYKLVYEPRLWPKEIDFYSKAASERGAGMVWGEWPIFGDICEINFTVQHFGSVDSWEAWQGYLDYGETVQEGLVNTLKELSRIDMRKMVELHKMSRTENELFGPPILLYDGEAKVVWMIAIGEESWITYYWKAPQ